MKIVFRCLLIWIFLQLNPLTAASWCQQTAASPQAAAPTPTPVKAPELFSTAMKKTVAFLKTEFQDGDHPGSVQGTGFFLFVPDKRLGEHVGLNYLVTNRHMIEPEISGRKVKVSKISIRLNLKSPVHGVQAEEGDLPVGPTLHWYFPADSSVDLAVLPINPDPTHYDFESLPISFLATTERIKSEQISEGDSVLFAGFFYQFPGQKKLEPIVRQGILAMMPDEPINTTLNELGHLYLADVHVFGGNSGAPMFVILQGVRNGKLHFGNLYALLGVVSGYYYETADFQLQVATTLTGKAAANSGISLIVPADELKALIDSPELLQQREEVVKKYVEGKAR